MYRVTEKALANYCTAQKKEYYYIPYFKAILFPRFLLPMPVSALMMVAHVG